MCLNSLPKIDGTSLDVDEIIVDASIVAKWFFPEEDSQIALKIKDDFTKGAIGIAVPILFYYEVCNLLKSAVKSSRVDSGHAEVVFKDFLKYGLVGYFTSDLQKESLTLSIKLDISSYDASYIVLAEYLKKPFFTADKKLLLKVKNKFVFALENYPVSS